MSKLSEEEIIEILQDNIEELKGTMVIKHTNTNKINAIERNIRTISARKRKE